MTTIFAKTGNVKLSDKPFNVDYILIKEGVVSFRMYDSNEAPAFMESILKARELGWATVEFRDVIYAVNDINYNLKYDVLCFTAKLAEPVEIL